MNPVNISDLIRILDLDRNGSSKIWHSCDFEYFSRDGYEEKSGQFHSFQQINDSPIEKKKLGNFLPYPFRTIAKALMLKR